MEKLQNMKKKKNNKWMRFRHRVVTEVLRAVLSPYCKLRYGIHVEKFAEQGDRPYLVLYNHQTAFDQFFVGISFKGPVYYVASEDIFSKGFVSSLIRWLVNPIPIKKQATDLVAVLNCIRVAREGGTIAIAPEGNRTYSGKTEYMSPAIAQLAKKLKLPIAIYRIEGGYGVHPRWSDCVRKGSMRSYVAKVIEPEFYASMSDDELYALIQDELYVDEGNSNGSFLSNKRAEYLERAVYVCPYCGFAKFESHGNVIECTSCHRKIEYGTDKKLSGIDFDFKFDFFTQWYDYQKDFVSAADVTLLTDSPIFSDLARLSEVVPNQRKDIIKQSSSVKLYGDRVTVDEGSDSQLVYPFSEITAISVLGRNKLNIYHDKKIYQFKGDKRFNALKYVNIYYRYKNITKGDENGKFLGL